MAKILLLEDEMQVREPLANFLTKEGYSVTAVGSLQEARIHLTSGVDLGVFDWTLPDGQGVDLVRDCQSRGVKISHFAPHRAQRSQRQDPRS